MTEIHLKRVYETPAKEDGVRILVERLWPRGVSREDAALDHWAKDIAPSPELREWYGHDPAKWAEFRDRYREELEDNGDEVARLRDICADDTVTFVYAAKDEARNSAVVLRKFLGDS